MRTAADGTAHAHDLAAGDWAISASADGHAPGAAPTLALHARDDARIAIALAVGGAALSGVITDASGGPIAGARIDAARLDARAKPADAVASTTSGADGHYRVTVAPGQLVVAVSDPDYAPIARFVDVTATGATPDFSLVPGGAIEGVVRDEHTHTVVAGAEVEAHRDSAGVALAEAGTTRGADRGRRWTSSHRRSPPGNYEVRASADNRASRTPTMLGLGVAEQRSDLEVLIAALPVVRGTVVDDAGVAIGGARVLASSANTQQDALADAHGAFAILGLHPGRYRLSASSAEHLPAGNVEIVVAAADVNDVRVVVHRGAEVHVTSSRARSPRCRSAPTRVARWRCVSSRRRRPLPTARSRFARSPMARPASTRAPRAVPPATPRFTAVGKDTGEVVITLSPGGSIAGRVVDGAGKPVGAVTVIAASTTDASTTIVNGVVTSKVKKAICWSATGDYELRGIMAGSYGLSVVVIAAIRSPRTIRPPCASSSPTARPRPASSSSSIARSARSRAPCWVSMARSPPC